MKLLFQVVFFFSTFFLNLKVLHKKQNKLLRICELAHTGGFNSFGRIACEGDEHEAGVSSCAVNSGMALESKQEGC